MLYRVLRRLATGPSRNRHIEPGSVVCGDRLGLGAVSILVRKGALSPVSAPPLDAFPGWKLRAARFTKAGYDAVRILETEDAALARAIGSNVRSIQKWKDELRDFLGLSGGEPKGCGCRGKTVKAPEHHVAHEEEITLTEEAIYEEPQPEAVSEPGEALKQEGSDGTDE